MKCTHRTSILAMLIVGCMMGMLYTVEAQVISRNEDDEIIVTYADGSWRHFMSSDSTMLEQAFENFLLREASIADGAQSTGQGQYLSEDDERRLLMLQTRKRRIDDGLLEVRSKEYAQLVQEIQELMDIPAQEIHHIVQDTATTSSPILSSTEDQRPPQPDADALPVFIDQAQQATIVHRAPAGMNARTEYAFELPKPGQPLSTGICREDTSDQLRITERRVLMMDTLLTSDVRLQQSKVPPITVSVALMDVYGSVFLTTYIDVDPDMELWPSGMSLHAGEVININLLDGHRVRLYQSTDVLPRREPFSSRARYRIKTLLTKDDIRHLSRSGIDNIFISTPHDGYTYEVYDVFLLHRQLICLEHL